MKKRLGFIFFLAVLTASGIFIFQLYWVYNSYKTGERNFNTQLLNALHSSISAYPLTQNAIPSTLHSKQPYLSVVKSFTDDQNKQPVDVNKNEFPHKKIDVQFQALSIKPENLLVVQQMIAQLAAQSAGVPLHLDVLTSLFNAELKKNGINLPCKLTLIKRQKQLPKGKIAAFVNFSAQSDVVEVVPQGINGYLLKQNLPPAAISILLILISAGSLWYMGFIIRRQMQLDDLKNEFINNITHELRTPISILKSTHEALYKFGEASDPEKTNRYLEINTIILEKLDNNVDRILDISRYEQGAKFLNLEPIVLDDLITETIARFRLNGQSTIQYISDLNRKVIITDAYIVDSVVSNLIDNALKYADEAASVVITIRTLTDGWQLQIEDNGKGIDERYLPFIFDKFYRVPMGDLHDVKGYGLGLSYVKQLVNTMKGDIKVKSKPGVGTIFTIKFPQTNG